MVWDNFQRGQEIRDQQGRRLSKFLIGTVEAAHRVIPFQMQRWNNRNVYMTYDHLQPRPSPLGMRAYETFDPLSLTFGTDIFLNHNEIAVTTTPCFSGERVCCYEHIIGLRKYICDMRRVFSQLFDCKEIEIGVNADHISKFYEYSTSTKSKEFYSAAYNMQRRSVLDWNADLHHPECPKDSMRLTGARSLNYIKMIGKHGMKKRIYCIELCRKHVLDTPNRRGGGNDARFQLIIVGPHHRDDLRCVSQRPIVKSIVWVMG